MNWSNENLKPIQETNDVIWIAKIIRKKIKLKCRDAEQITLFVY